MASNPQFPRPDRPHLVERREPRRRRPFPWLLVAAVVTLLVAIGIAWYFFH